MLPCRGARADCRKSSFSLSSRCDVVGQDGIEPPTFAFSERRSTPELLFQLFNPRERGKDPP